MQTAIMIALGDFYLAIVVGTETYLCFEQLQSIASGKVVFR